MNISIPNRASDAGPDTHEPEPDWTDYLSFAADEITDASRFNHDNLKIELWHRQDAIDRAIEALREARAALPHQRTAFDLGVS